MRHPRVTAEIGVAASTVQAKGDGGRRGTEGEGAGGDGLSTGTRARIPSRRRYRRRSLTTFARSPPWLRGSPRQIPLRRRGSPSSRETDAVSGTADRNTAAPHVSIRTTNSANRSDKWMGNRRLLLRP